jgi:hypothetical protein
VFPKFEPRAWRLAQIAWFAFGRNLWASVLPNCTVQAQHLLQSCQTLTAKPPQVLVAITNVDCRPRLNSSDFRNISCLSVMKLVTLRWKCRNSFDNLDCL